MPPYYIASLQHLCENEKSKHRLAQGVVATKENELRFAGGVFMHLPLEKQFEILSLLPAVTPTLAYQYQLATQQAAAKKDPQSGVRMEVESKRRNPTLFIV